MLLVCKQTNGLNPDPPKQAQSIFFIYINRNTSSNPNLRLRANSVRLAQSGIVATMDFIRQGQEMTNSDIISPSYP